MINIEDGVETVASSLANLAITAGGSASFVAWKATWRVHAARHAIVCRGTLYIFLHNFRGILVLI